MWLLVAEGLWSLFSSSLEKKGGNSTKNEAEDVLLVLMTFCLPVVVSLPDIIGFWSAILDIPLLLLFFNLQSQRGLKGLLSGLVYFEY